MTFTYEDLDENLRWEIEASEDDGGWAGYPPGGSFDVRIDSEEHVAKGDSAEEAIRELLDRLQLPKDPLGYDIEIEGWG